MNKRACTFNTLYMSIMLFTTLSIHGMEKCELLELSNQVELPTQKYDENFMINLINLPTELFPSIQSLENTIKFFMKLSSICKKFNRLLTFEEIGKRCKDYSLKDKNDALHSLPRLIKPSHRLPTFILICAGGNVTRGGMTLLESAVTQNDEQLVRLLFEHKADPNTVTYSRNPVFFLIKTVDMARIFIDNRCDIHKTCNHGCNILWHIMDNSYPANLMEFYLAQNVDTKMLASEDKKNFWRAESLLHRFAETPYSGTFKDFLNFTAKANLLFTTIPDQVNAADKYGRTPLDIVEESLRKAESSVHSASERESKIVGRGSNKEAAALAFKCLKELFSEYDGLTADLLECLINKELREKNIPLVCKV